MNGNHFSPDQDEVDHLLANLDKLREKHISKELDSVTLSTNPHLEKKEISHVETQGSLPRLGSRYVSEIQLFF